MQNYRHYFHHHHCNTIENPLMQMSTDRWLQLSWPLHHLVHYVSYYPEPPLPWNRCLHSPTNPNVAIHPQANWRRTQWWFTPILNGGLSLMPSFRSHIVLVYSMILCYDFDFDCNVDAPPWRTHNVDDLPEPIMLMMMMMSLIHSSAESNSPIKWRQIQNAGNLKSPSITRKWNGFHKIPVIFGKHCFLAVLHSIFFGIISGVGSLPVKKFFVLFCFVLCQILQVCGHVTRYTLVTQSL